MEFWSEASTEWLVNIGLPEWLALTVVFLLGAAVLVFGVLLVIIFLVWLLRKVIGRIQERLGPNRLGPWGLFSRLRTC